MQDAEEAAKLQSRDMARHAVGVLDAGRGAGNARRSYAQDLEDQIRAKKVGRARGDGRGRCHTAGLPCVCTFVV